MWMAAVYGRTWTGQYAGETAKVAIAAWGDGLFDLTDEHLEAGRRGTLKRHSDWPPSLPEFRRLCLGLGSDADAVEAAMNRDRDHPIGRYIVGGITSWDWSNLSTKDLEKRCRGGLEDARRRAEEDAIENPPLLSRTTKAISRERHERSMGQSYRWTTTEIWKSTSIRSGGNGGGTCMTIQAGRARHDGCDGAEGGLA